MMQRLHVDMPGEELRERIEANLAQQRQPELVRIHLVRSRSDFTTTMPRFVTAYLEQQLDVQEGRRS
jgi:BMFP domain-containing protein YqiC